MNNAEYATWRERAGVNFANEYPEIGLAMTKLGLSYALPGAVTYRYRKDLKCLQKFTIVSRIVGWTETSFLVESEFRAPAFGQPDFVYCHSIAHMKFKVLGRGSGAKSEDRGEDGGEDAISQPKPTFA